MLVADALWVSWTLHFTRALDGEFLLLYFFVLLLTMVGEDLVMVVLGAVVVSAVNAYASWGTRAWASPVLLRVVFLFTVALFYGHVLSSLKRERQRGAQTLRWARELETKVAERTAELNRLYDESRAASAGKSEFIASMSHELRTPLHVIIGYTDMLLDHAATTRAECDRLIGRIRCAGSELLHLVDSVLDIVRLEAGRVCIEPRTVSLAAFVDELRQREWMAPAADVTLHWDIESSPTEIETDPAKLQIVLCNLISNAIKYTRAGSIVVSVRDLPDLRQVEFGVEDTGPGIPAAQLATVHEPFHESGPSAHKLAGVGLGLTIVYRYAQQLGTELTARSTVGAGTAFRIRVPYQWCPTRDDPPRLATAFEAA